MKQSLKFEVEKAIADYFYGSIELDDPEMSRDEYMPEARRLVERILRGDEYKKKGQLAIITKDIFTETFESKYEIEPFLQSEDGLREVLRHFGL